MNQHRIVIHAVCNEGSDAERSIQAVCAHHHAKEKNSAYIDSSQSLESWQAEQRTLTKGKQ